ncbi:peptidylprolyl isomerase A [soil metagenome]
MYGRAILSTFFALFCAAGWNMTAAGWSAGRPGPAHAATVVSGGTESVSQGRGTATVQAPPLRPPAPEPAPGNPIGVISTTHGEITIELFREQAPVSVENFLQYAADGFYDGTIFHRVVPKFMIQGGGYTPSLAEKPTRPPIQNEATNGLRNLRGTVAMARKQTLRSATSQFYINVADNRMLDHTGYTPIDFGYAVFGRVLEGMDVVDRISVVPTGLQGEMADVPEEPVIIKSVRVKP